MRTLLALALVVVLLFILAGGLAVALVAPAWVGPLYGLVGAVAVWCGLDVIGDVWAARPVR